MARRIPTVAEMIPKALEACPSVRTRELYGKYLQGLVELHGQKPVNIIVASEIMTYANLAKVNAVRRRTSNRGASAFEHAVSAARKLFDVAINDGYMTVNPAKAVKKPKRPESRRAALTDDQVDEVYAAIGQSQVHAALVTFLLETGARRDGLLSMDPSDVRRTRQTILLTEKGDKQREQPMSKMMTEYLLQEGCPLYAITRRQLDSFWLRLQRQLPWAEEIGLTTHTFRHTAISNIERATGSYVLAATFAGHSLSGLGATASYVNKYGVADVAWAFCQVYDLEHPLARKDRPEGLSRLIPAAGPRLDEM